jgi:hypothetical protein
MTKPTREQIKEMADLVADRSIREEGSLSPVIDVYTKEIQAAQDFYLDVAYDLNRLALAAWSDVDAGENKSDLLPVVNRILLRAINGFGGAITLTRRGMDIEAQTLARTIYECAFWLGYFGAEPDEALSNFETENRRSILAHNVLLGKQGVIPEEIATASAEALETLKRIKVPGMEKMAGKGDLASVFPFYKFLCGMAAHSSMASIDRLLDEPIAGKLSHAFDFTGKRLPETVGFAITGLLAALVKWQAITKVPLDEAVLLRVDYEVPLMFAEQDRRDRPKNA